MVNIPKLKGKMVENELSISEISERIGVDRATIYRKLKSGGDSFTIAEVQSMAKELRLNTEDINSIFFAR